MRALAEAGSWVGEFVERLRTGESTEPIVKERLIEADRKKDQFLMLLAHELRNPLAAIRSAVDVLRLVGTSNTNSDRAIDAIERQSKHMLHLVEGLLDVGRIARGKLHLEPEVLDLGVLLHDLIEDRREYLMKKRLKTRFELGDEPIRIIGDRTRIAQVFDNLLGNAVKFTPAGGTITISGARELDRAIVRVVDTGVGISPEQRTRIFRPFVQLRTDARGTGLGLGLALTKLLVELHGGTIEVTSEGIGKGTTFEVRLPTESRDLPGFEDRRRRILLVEDEDDCLLISQLLQRSGHEVRCVATGEEAIELVARWRPDVVLSALDLPGRMSGDDTARALRMDPEHGNIALVALTGYGESSEGGVFDAQLMKPAALDDIERVIDEVSSRS
jgi:nitrogen-specific signal transduction histidine kinase/CheY-like chemotaxis protein